MKKLEGKMKEVMEGGPLEVGFNQKCLNMVEIEWESRDR